MTQDEIELADILTLYDWYLWVTFLDENPGWKLRDYGERVSIESKYGWTLINSVSMEKALETAKRLICTRATSVYYGNYWI